MQADSYSRELAFHIDVQFAKLLRSHGIVPLEGSPMQRCRAALQSWVTGFTDVLGDARQDLQESIGLTDLAANIVSVSASPSFQSLVPHLQLLAKGTPSHSVAVRTVDESTSKLFELLVACWSIRAGASVTMEDPFVPAAPNPDIIAVTDEGRVAIACKETFSRSAQTHIQRVVEGSQQIQRAGGEGVGVVVIHPRHIVDRDILFPMRGKAGDANDPPRYRSCGTEAHAYGLVSGSVKSLMDRIGPIVASAGSEWKVPLAGIVASAQAVACCEGFRRLIDDSIQYGPYPLMIRHAYLYGIAERVTAGGFVERLRDESVHTAADLVRLPDQ